MNILFITDNVLYVSGVSKHLFYLLSEFSKDEDYNIILLCPGGDFLEEFKKLRISVVVKKEISHHERSFLNFIKSIWFIYNLLNKQKIRIIHSHTHYSANLASWASMFSKLITVQTIHGIIPPGGILPHFIADYFITVNRNTIDYLVSIGKERKRIFYVNLGIPFPQKQVKSNNDIKVIFASRLVPEKGADIYLDAVAVTKDKLKKKVSFILAGEGECEQNLMKQIAALQIDINFIGKIRDTNSYLKDTHIFVFSSKYQSEGFPLTVVEAAMNGNLIISSDFISLKEIFVEGEDCLVFYNNDPLLLAEKIIIAVNNYNNYSGMIINSTEKAKKNFSVDKMVLELKNIYRNVG